MNSVNSLKKFSEFLQDLPKTCEMLVDNFIYLFFLNKPEVEGRQAIRCKKPNQNEQK